MAGVCRKLEPPFLTTAQTQLPANPLDPMNTHNDAIIRQIPLQTLRPIRLACTSMSSLYLQFQSFLFLLSAGKRTFDPSIISALCYIQYSAQKHNRIGESQLLNQRVPFSDSLAKYAAAFFKMSRSILARDSSLFTCANSISISVSGRRPLPTSPRFPTLKTLIQRSNVDFGKDNRLDISITGKPPSVIILTASSRNSFVYRPCGTLSILTPPSSFLSKHWCPSFSTYHRFALRFKLHFIRFQLGSLVLGSRKPRSTIKTLALPSSIKAFEALLPRCV